jgi:hypothetical protein
LFTTDDDDDDDMSSIPWVIVENDARLELKTPSQTRRDCRCLQGVHPTTLLMGGVLLIHAHVREEDSAKTI